jgi:predicted CoA-binding protein
LNEDELLGEALRRRARRHSRADDIVSVFRRLRDAAIATRRSQPAALFWVQNDIVSPEAARTPAARGLTVGGLLHRDHARRSRAGIGVTGGRRPARLARR